MWAFQHKGIENDRFGVIETVIIKGPKWNT